MEISCLNFTQSAVVLRLLTFQDNFRLIQLSNPPPPKTKIPSSPINNNKIFLYKKELMQSTTIQKILNKIGITSINLTELTVVLSLVIFQDELRLI